SHRGSPYNDDSVPRSSLISNATCIDAELETIQPGRSIGIRNGRLEIPARGDYDEIIDATGAFVCPGLIDAHVHLFLDAGLDPRGAFMASDDASKMRTAANNAGRAIDCGITTIRDCGGPAELVFRIRRAIEDGEVRGPRVLASG